MSKTNRGRRATLGWRVPLAGFRTPFQRVLDRIDAGLSKGTIEAILPDGSRRTLGGRSPGPVAIVEVRHPRALWRLVTGGSAGWYEAWAAGEWASPDPVPLFDLFMRNRRALGDTGRARGLTRTALRWAHRLHRNSRGGAKRNIHYHYDLGNDFYAAWLDATMTYSSARFAEPYSDDEPLESAQQRKLARMLERTATAPGERILEIGCGWGSFAETAARAGRRVHGVTLSPEQKAYAERRCAALGGVTIALADYRDVRETYDAVVSIEMVEAVGREYWDAYCASIARVLKPGGRAAIQFISIDDAIFDAYAANVDFIQAYVFPGGMLLSEPRFRSIAERHGLSWQDREGFGHHYAETLKRWRQRFEAAEREGRLPAELDRPFRDLWRFYLMYCEGGFRGGGIDVAQVTLVKGA